MSDQALFEAVLAELAVVRNRLDYLNDAVLIGGQVLAVEQMAAGAQAVFQVETDTGQRIQRPFSMEPDLLVDPPAFEESALWDQLPETLKECGFHMTGRTFRWAKNLNGGTMELDLFMPEGHADPVVNMTPLKDGLRILGRAHEVVVPVQGRELRIKLPHPADFIRMKLDNLERPDAVRREEHKGKDALDIYGYIHLKTPEVIAAAFKDPRDEEALTLLRRHFGSEQAPGVLRVLKMVPGFSGDEAAMVAKHLVRTVAAVLRGRTRARGPSL